MLRRCLRRCTPQDAVFETQNDGKLGILRLHRPEKLNAFSVPMCDVIKSSASAISQPDSKIRTLIITGDVRSFSAGKDLKASLQHTEEEAAEYYDATVGAIKALLGVPVPIIAGIERVCLGLGLELALTADIRIASASCKIGFPEINLSLFPGCGGAVLLPLLLGNVSVASDLILTGRQLSAQEAQELGLVSRIVPDGSSLDECISLAQPLLTKERDLLIKTKQVIKYAFNRELNNGPWMNLSEKYRTELGKSQAHLSALNNFVNRKHR